MTTQSKNIIVRGWSRLARRVATENQFKWKTTTFAQSLAFVTWTRGKTAEREHEIGCENGAKLVRNWREVEIILTCQLK